MANKTFEFIAETGEAASYDAQNRRKVRSYAMKRVRQQQKLDRAGDYQTLLRKDSRICSAL